MVHTILVFFMTFISASCDGLEKAYSHRQRLGGQGVKQVM
ncbi:hypothetical protein NT01EI_1847 [Edwardsiella ictaluri 93-146]|uniref:Uncharacterized protein n=1 Tax=Edwardsiella ictaluri (strain 93-146) TaxID=634503 RepID=C5BGU5_EDWI9|nr:hypothetical protein NT01EI_1847 [Edwardsiella ictaluri 93-146]